MPGETVVVDEQGGVTRLEERSLRAFSSRDEYVWAMKEDLSEWFNLLYETSLTADNFTSSLKPGVILCRHANRVLGLIREWLETKPEVVPPAHRHCAREYPASGVACHEGALGKALFYSRDNVSNFLAWCRALGMHDNLLFETNDLMSDRQERNVIVTLLELARLGSRYGLAVPTIIQMEQEIDAEIEAEARGEPIEPPPQIVTNDLMSLDEMVCAMLARCTCPIQFPLVRVSEGKYRVGDSKTVVFVRVLRNHVMIRVGGGWDTLDHYLDKHDPCRCKTMRHSSKGRRSSMGSPFMDQSSVEKKRRASAAQPSRPFRGVAEEDERDFGMFTAISGQPSELDDTSSSAGHGGEETWGDSFQGAVNITSKQPERLQGAASNGSLSGAEGSLNSTLPRNFRVGNEGSVGSAKKMLDKKMSAGSDSTGSHRRSSEVHGRPKTPVSQLGSTSRRQSDLGPADALTQATQRSRETRPGRPRTPVSASQKVALSVTSASQSSAALSSVSVSQNAPSSVTSPRASPKKKPPPLKRAKTETVLMISRNQEGGHQLLTSAVPEEDPTSPTSPVTLSPTDSEPRTPSRMNKIDQLRMQQLDISVGWKAKTEFKRSSTDDSLSSSRARPKTPTLPLELAVKQPREVLEEEEYVDLDTRQLRNKDRDESSEVTVRQQTRTKTYLEQHEKRRRSRSCDNITILQEAAKDYQDGKRGGNVVRRVGELRKTGKIEYDAKTGRPISPAGGVTTARATSSNYRSNSPALGRRPNSPALASCRPSSPAPANRRPMSPASANRRPMSPAPANRRPSSPAPTNRRPMPPAPANRRPNSPAPANRRPSSPAPTNRQLYGSASGRPSSPAPANRRPNSPASANRRPMSPASANRKPATRETFSGRPSSPSVSSRRPNTTTPSGKKEHTTAPRPTPQSKPDRIPARRPPSPSRTGGRAPSPGPSTLRPRQPLSSASSTSSTSKSVSSVTSPTHRRAQSPAPRSTTPVNPAPLLHTRSSSDLIVTKSRPNGESERRPRSRTPVSVLRRQEDTRISTTSSAVNHVTTPTSPTKARATNCAQSKLSSGMRPSSLSTTASSPHLNTPPPLPSSEPPPLSPLSPEARQFLHSSSNSSAFLSEASEGEPAVLDFGSWSVVHAEAPGKSDSRDYLDSTDTSQTASTTSLNNNRKAHSATNGISVTICDIAIDESHKPGSSNLRQFSDMSKSCEMLASEQPKSRAVKDVKPRSRTPGPSSSSSSFGVKRSRIPVPMSRTKSVGQLNEHSNRGLSRSDSGVAVNEYF